MNESDRRVRKIFKGIKVTYTEVYHLAYKVDESTGMIDTSKKVKCYTKDQVNSNLKSLKKAYLKKTNE